MSIRPVRSERWREWGRSAAAALLLMLPAGATTAEETKSTLIAVVDGSGSMWGGLGRQGVSKLAAARDALSAVLPRLGSTHKLGLATFGPGCRSAELAMVPDGADAAAVVAPLARFNPRGKGPLSAGLKAAAGAFGDKGSGAIVLIHDGLDNCGEDACAAASSLHQFNPSVKVSTISLGMGPGEVAAIACVSKATSGRALTADDPAGLLLALDEIAATIGKPASPEQIAAPSKPPPEPEPAKVGPPRLVASARLTDGGAVITTPVSWRITSADAGKVLHEAVAPALSVPLPEGQVGIEVSSGRVKVRRDAKIAAQGDTAVDVVLNAGIVRFDTGAKKLASDADEPLIRLAAIGEAAANESGAPTSQNPAPLWIARGKAIEALLPPGEYRAVAEYGLARATATVAVAAGAVLNLALPLEAGRLEISTAPAGRASVTYRIAVDDTEHPDGRREIARTAHPTPAFVLSTGAYYVTATSGTSQIRRSVTVRSGEVTREDFAFDLASLEVSARLNGAAPGQAPLEVLLAPKPGPGKEAGEPERLIPLGRPVEVRAGTYRITLQHGLSGARLRQDVTVAAGDAQRITLDLRTAELQFDMAGPDGAARGAVCELKSSDGIVLWRSVEVKPRILVEPGSFALRCRVGETVREAAITVAAGDVASIKPFAK